MKKKEKLTISNVNGNIAQLYEMIYELIDEVNELKEQKAKKKLGSSNDK